jgi:hypothetical protein
MDVSSPLFCSRQLFEGAEQFLKKSAPLTSISPQAANTGCSFKQFLNILRAIGQVG